MKTAKKIATKPVKKEKETEIKAIKKWDGRKDGKTSNKVYAEKKKIVVAKYEELSVESLRSLPAGEVERRVQQYLSECGLDWFGRLTGERIREYPTLAGLAMYLGVSRFTLLNLQSREDLFNPINRCRQIIEHLREQKLWEGGNQSGTIFVLKNNHGWKEEQYNKNVNINIPIEDIDTDFDFLSPDKS